MKLTILKIQRAVVCIAYTIALSANTALAQERQMHDGLVINYHLNGTVGDRRGVCIRMDPPIPGSGWACVYRDNRLYEEITNLLLEAMTASFTSGSGGSTRSSGLGCRITYIERTGIQPVILIAECSRREFYGY